MEGKFWRDKRAVAKVLCLFIIHYFPKEFWWEASSVTLFQLLEYSNCPNILLRNCTPMVGGNSLAPAFLSKLVFDMLIFPPDNRPLTCHWLSPMAEFSRLFPYCIICHLLLPAMTFSNLCVSDPCNLQIRTQISSLTPVLCSSLHLSAYCVHYRDKVCLEYFF